MMLTRSPSLSLFLPRSCGGGQRKIP
jgi:hypothetical protein